MCDYAALIIDIENSKKYIVEERNEIQNYIFFCIEQLNKLFGSNMRFDVTFSAGDELQGLFKDVTTAVLYFRLFEMLIKPVNIRAGIGIGEWTIKVKEGLSTQQDGPVYHRARKAVEEVHKMQLQNIRICSENDDIIANHLLNASILLKRQQIYMQNMVFSIMEFLYPFVTDEMKLIDYETIVKTILKKKFEYRIRAKQNYSFSNKKEDLRSLNIEDFEIPVADPIIIDGNCVEAENVIGKKNVAATISKILGSTRQNVELIIKRGNANKIRELDFMALQYVRKQYGGEVWN